ncbi:MAG: S46 family peptidase [Candidatus Krumholzibacteria bacterium]
MWAVCSRLPLTVVLAVVLPTAAGPGPFVAQTARASEGMWLLHALDTAPYNEWRSRGLELDRYQLYDPKRTDVSDAVIKLGGGTASFVSPEGLIVTNHHVAAGALQRASSVEHNYLEDGFYASTRSEEIPAQGYDAYILQSVENVTKDVMRKVKKDMSNLERHKAIENAEKRIIARAEKGKDVEVDVRSIYGGSEYYLYTYFKIKDVRVVYAPPKSIGVYGGDIDNWMWPRHTGDFAFLRAYVGPDGKSADHSEDNVPYRPRNHLAFSTSPLKAGDFTMVIGYPGRTSRHRSSYSIDYVVNRYYPSAIQRYENLLAILEDESAKDPQAKIKLASSVSGLNNGYKNNQGMLEGLEKYNLLEMKREEEKTLRAFLESHPDAAARYGGVLDGLREQYDEYIKISQQNSTLRWMLYMNNAMRSAYRVYKWNIEQEKSDTERDPDYMPRDEPRLRRGLKLADKRYHEGADKRILKYFLTRAATFEAGERFAIVDKIVGAKEGEAMERAIDEYVEKLYAGTRVTDQKTRLEMFDAGSKKLRARNDPFIELAAALEVEKVKFEEMTDSFDGAVQRLRPKLIALRQEHRGGTLYPDANRTMRLSTGEVKGYSPADAVTYDFLTSLGGIIAKHTGEEPFDAPDRLLELYRNKDFGVYADPTTGDVPVCFLTTDDITGGNSGSAVLNGKGEIIGLAFDGNYESISSDYLFLPGLTRCISVDSRYILFILEKFSGTHGLLEELTVEQHARM